MEPAQILEHIDSFKAFLALERNCSKGTLVEYSSDLKAFVEYLQPKKRKKS
jgi:site-specific recombinase XerD